MKLVCPHCHPTFAALPEPRQKIERGIRPFLRVREELSRRRPRDSTSPLGCLRNCDVGKCKLSRSHSMWVMEPLNRCTWRTSRPTEFHQNYARLLPNQLR